MQFLRRVVISVVGGTVLLIGIAMIFLPLPSIIVIPAGLAILALEYAWARHWLNKFRALIPGKRAPSDTRPTKEKAALPGQL